jgi:hypothetical protein
VCWVECILAVVCHRVSHLVQQRPQSLLLQHRDLRDLVRGAAGTTAVTVTSGATGDSFTTGDTHFSMIHTTGRRPPCWPTQQDA